MGGNSSGGSSAKAVDERIRYSDLDEDLKKGAISVRIAKPGEDVEGVLIKQEVNILDKFSLGRNDLAEKLGLTGPRTSALIRELEICDDPECFREISIKSQTWKRYSPKALARIQAALDEGLEVEEVWKRHRSGARKGASRRKRAA